MPIQIDGKTPDTIRIGRDDGSLATVGEARVWDGRWKTVYESWKPRTVTINTTASTWDVNSSSGDEDLIQSLLTTGVTFVEDVVCDTTVRTATNVSPGTRLPAGTSIRPATPIRVGQTFTFTSVRP